VGGAVPDLLLELRMVRLQKKVPFPGTFLKFLFEKGVKKN